MEQSGNVAETLHLVLPDDTRLPLIGEEARMLGVVVEDVSGLTDADARVVATGGPGQPAQAVREVLATVPSEITLAGVFVSTGSTGSSAAMVAYRYAAALDPMRGLAPEAPYAQPRLRYVTDSGVYERSVVVLGIRFPRRAGEWNARRFELTLASYEPYWTEAYARTRPLVAGQNQVTVGGVWFVYPRLRFVAGAGGLTNLTITATTDGGRQLSFTTTYPQGTELVVDNDPLAATIALVGQASQQGVMANSDRRFRLWPGRTNVIELQYSGTLASATIEWQERWTVV